MMDNTLSCFFGAQWDEGNDQWLAIMVYRDGNPIILDRFETEEEAEDCAEAIRQEMLQDSSQFGVGG